MEIDTIMFISFTVIFYNSNVLFPLIICIVIITDAAFPIVIYIIYPFTNLLRT